MPKIDPVTGCTVMTQAEFWNEEAANEGQGRTGYDLMTDFYDEMERDRARHEDSYRDPQAALATLQEEVKEWNQADTEGQLPLPTKVLEVLEVEVKQTYRESGLRLKVRATRRRKGKEIEDILTFWSCQTSGTMLDPPDYEADIQWENYKP